MTIRLELGEQSALQRRLLLLPNQDAGDAPATYNCVLRNTGGAPITIVQLGTLEAASGGFTGYVVRVVSGTIAAAATNVELAANATHALGIKVLGATDPDELDTGVWNGQVMVRWFVTSAGIGSIVQENVFVTGIVRDTALPDLRVTKDQLFSEHVLMHLVCGGANVAPDPTTFGLRPDILTTGYLAYFTNEIPPMLAWANVGGGGRANIFIDRWTGSNPESNNNQFLPFDGVIDLLDSTSDALEKARDTFVAGFDYLGTLDCNLFVYMGSMCGDTDFLALANADDTVGLMARLNRSIEPIMRLPNLHTMIFDEPYCVGVSPNGPNQAIPAADPRNRLYEMVRRVCQARGVNIAAEPRGPAVRDIQRPQDGVGLCQTIGFGQLTNPSWDLDPDRDNSHRRTDESALGLELIEWSISVPEWQTLAVIAGTRIRSNSLGRADSKPQRTIFIPWPYSKSPGQGGTRQMTAQALTDIVNGYIAVVTGDAGSASLSDGPVDIPT